MPIAVVPDIGPRGFISVWQGTRVSYASLENTPTGERGSIRRTVPNGMTAGSAPGGLAP